MRGIGIGIGISLNALAAASRAAAAALPSLWLDSDVSVDPDDALAFAVMSGAQREGTITMLGGTSSSRVPAGPAVIKGFFGYAGFPNLPVGANKSGIGSTGSDWAAGVATMLGQGSKVIADFPEAVATMRTAFTALTSNNNVFVMLGGATNLAAFLQQTADRNLLAAKFARVVVMGGRWPGPNSYEYNIAEDSDAAAYVAANCPIPVWYAGDDVTGALKCGPPTTTGRENTDPYRKALVLTPSQVDGQGKRQAFDPATMLWAIQGPASTMFGRVRGTATFPAGTAGNSWANNSSGNHYYMTKSVADSVINAELDRLINLAYTPNSPVLTGGTPTPTPSPTPTPTPTPTAWTFDDIATAKKVGFWDPADTEKVTAVSGNASAIADEFGIRNIGQTTAAKRPAIGATSFDSLPGLTFTDDMLTGAISGLTDNLTLFFFLNPGAQTTDARLWSMAGASSPDHEGDGAIVYIGADGKIRVFQVGNKVTVDLGTGPMLLTVHLGVNPFVNKNGFTLMSATGQTGANWALATRFAIGSAIQGSTENLQGVIGGVAAFKDLTADEILRIQGYLAHSKGKAGYLDASHPYKSAAPSAAGSGTSSLAPTSGNRMVLGANNGMGSAGGSGTLIYNNFQWATNAEIDLDYASGMRFSRIGYSSFRVIDGPMGNLNTTNIPPLISVIDYALGKGMAVSPEPHDYGTFMYDQTMTLSTIPALVDSMNRVFGKYKTNQNVWMAFQNEPYRLGSSLMSLQQAWINQMRTAGFTGPLVVSVQGEAGYAPLRGFNDAAQRALAEAITDPLNKLIWDGHFYVDYNFSGQNIDVFSVTNQASGGWSNADVNDPTLRARVRAYLDGQLGAGFNWFRATGRKVLIGEAALPDTPIANAASPHYFEWFNDYRDVIAAFALWNMAEWMQYKPYGDNTGYYFGHWPSTSPILQRAVQSYNALPA